jgi:16S rRNA (cytosine967-C5)-methyltransferase
MNRPVLRSSRATALKVLRQYDARRGDAAELLGSLLETTDRSGQATDLVYGVIRNTLLLDRLLTVCAGISRNNVKPALWNILRLGVYELVFAPKTAEYAILNEAVNLARTVGSQKSEVCQCRAAQCATEDCCTRRRRDCRCSRAVGSSR